MLIPSVSSTKLFYVYAVSGKKQRYCYFYRTGRSDEYFRHEAPEYWSTEAKAKGAMKHLKRRFPEFEEWFICSTYLYVREVS